MVEPLFGKAFTRDFIVDDGRAYITIPQQTPAIYIFSSMPTRQAAAQGTGAIQTIIIWAQQANSPKFTYTVAPISDPAPTGDITAYDYWEAINYTLDGASQVQTKIRSFVIKRAEALASIPGTTLADVKAVFPSLNKWIPDSEMEAFLSVAEFEVRRRVEKAGKVWARFQRLDDAKYAIAYQAIASAAEVQVIKGSGDKFVWMVNQFSTKAEQAISGDCMPYDSDGDGKAEAVEAVDRSYVTIAK